MTPKEEIQEQYLKEKKFSYMNPIVADIDYVKWLETELINTKKKLLIQRVSDTLVFIQRVSDTLILTPKDAEIFFNEIMNHKEANDALKKSMLKFITR
jgi:hypothetical protein